MRGIRDYVEAGGLMSYARRACGAAAEEDKRARAQGRGADWRGRRAARRGGASARAVPESQELHGGRLSFGGATWQARRDTAQVPGVGDWVCVAASGRSLTVRGTYDSDVEYRSLDVAMVNGSSFVALRDWPGPCPGDGWHLLASRGSRGSRGERGFAGLMGLRGERGEAAPTIRASKRLVSPPHWERNVSRLVSDRAAPGNIRPAY